MAAHDRRVERDIVDTNKTSIDHVEYVDPKSGLSRLRRSEDPNDPMNWPNSQKYWTLGTVCFFSFLSTVNTSKFTVAIGSLIKEFHQGTVKTGYLVSFSVLTLGLGNFIWLTMLRKCGRRPTFLLAILCLAVFNCWAAFAKSYESLLAATVLAGLAAGGGESPISSLIADLFFVDQRGTMMMIFHIALSCGFFLGPVVNAALAEFVSWRWICGWVSIASLATFVVGFFTIHETAYLQPVPRIDDSVDRERNDFRFKKSFIQELSLTSGVNKDLRVLTVIRNMISIVAYPPVLWAGLTVGAFVGWNIVVQVTAARTFVIAPYHFKLWQVGILSFAGLIGALVAMFFGGRLIDIMSNYWTARNNGNRIPEYRLPPLIIPTIIGPMGIVIFGVCLQHHTHWVGPAFGYAMQGFGLTAASNVLVTYTVDSYPTLAGEVLVVVFLIRGVSGCLLSLYAYDWVLAAGIGNTFGQMAAVQYFLALFAIAFYFYGRKIRMWTLTFGPSKHIVAY